MDKHNMEGQIICLKEGSQYRVSAYTGEVWHCPPNAFIMIIDIKVTDRFSCIIVVGR